MSFLMQCLARAFRRPHRSVWITMAATLIFAAPASSAPRAAGSTAAAASHGNPKLLLDLRPGDGGSAPDIFTTAVSNTANGILRFAVVLSNRSAIGPDDILDILINADRNRATGDEIGLDYIIQVRGAEIALARLLGSGRFEVVDAPGLYGTWRGTTQQIEVPASDLGNTASFVFYVHTFAVGGRDFDDSPDGDALADYTLLTPHIESLRTQFAPRASRAGTRLRVVGVTAHLESGEDVPADSFTCRASLPGKTLKGTGAGGCSFSLPRAAKGKTARIVVNARFRDQTKNVTYKVKVR